LKSRTILGGLAGLAILAIGGFSLWFFVLRDDGPAKVSTDAALDALGDRTATVANGSSPTAAAGQTPAVVAAGLNGTWTIDTSLDSFGGYRVKEELAGIGGATAVGRTKGVTGTVAITALKAGTTTITADMTALKSDAAFRDDRLQTQGIEYGKFPTAEFKLAPTELPSEIEDGATTPVTLNGSLTLHGVTKDVEVGAEATLKDGILVVVGEMDIEFADYAIEKPTAAKVVGMEDRGVMEFQLYFKKS